MNVIELTRKTARHPQTGHSSFSDMSAVIAFLPSILPAVLPE